MTDSTEAKPTLKLDCPKCSKTNTYRPSIGIKCSGCEEHLTGYRYQKYKHFLGGVLLVASTGFVGFKSADFLDGGKSSFAATYKIMDMCVSGDLTTLPRAAWSNKIDICGCVLELAMEKIDSKEDVSSRFITEVKRALPKCTG